MRFFQFKKEGRVMRKGFVISVSIICLGLLAGSFSVVGAADKVRGVTDTEIVIGQWGPQTGPAALWGAVARGTGVLFDMINEVCGMHGRKIKYVLRDVAYQPAKT